MHQVITRILRKRYDPREIDFDLAIHHPYAECPGFNNSNFIEHCSICYKTLKLNRLEFTVTTLAQHTPESKKLEAIFFQPIQRHTTPFVIAIKRKENTWAYFVCTDNHIVERAFSKNGIASRPSYTQKFNHLPFLYAIADMGIPQAHARLFINEIGKHTNPSDTLTCCKLSAGLPRQTGAKIPTPLHKILCEATTTASLCLKRRGIPPEIIRIIITSMQRIHLGESFAKIKQQGRLLADRYKIIKRREKDVQAIRRWLFSLNTVAISRAVALKPFDFGTTSPTHFMKRDIEKFKATYEIHRNEYNKTPEQTLASAMRDVEVITTHSTMLACTTKPQAQDLHSKLFHHGEDAYALVQRLLHKGITRMP